MRLVVIADTHMFHEDLDVPAGDVLIHAGDLTRNGSLGQLAVVAAFLAALPHRHKIVVAGNHDWAFQREPVAARSLLGGVTYLEDAETEIEGVKFYGTPWQAAYNDWAFNLPRGPELAAKWAKIPDDTDVLISHGPPMGIGDRTDMARRAGCADLLNRVLEIRPRLHVFGHVHSDRGRWERSGTTFVNATTDECLKPPTVVDFPPK